MITGGKVTFGRVVQPAQYETKRAEVEIFFSLPEGVGADAAQDELNKAADMAQAKALELVGLKRADAAPAGRATAKQTVEVAPEKAPEPAPEKPKTRTKADLEAEKKAELAAKEAEKAAAVTDPAAIPDVAPNISTTPEDRKDPAAMPEDEDLFKAEATPVSDADLRNTIMKVNEKVKNGPAIRALIGQYVQPGQGASEIPQKKRKAFLAELEQIKAP